MRWLWMIVAALPVLASADDRRVAFYADPVLVDSGVIAFVRPRFSLKTQIAVDLVTDPEQADLRLGAEGTPLFAGLGAVWHMDMARPTPAAERFATWFRSDVGQRTVMGFAPEGTPLFSDPPEVTVSQAPTAVSPEALRGKALALEKCGRCHGIDPARSDFTLGSTPSFMVIRSLPEWEDRFIAFYALKPHPAFTQIDEVTLPFPADRPSPIVPIHLTLEDVDAILAYAATLAAADLGGALQHQ